MQVMERVMAVDERAVDEACFVHVLTIQFAADHGHRCLCKAWSGFIADDVQSRFFDLGLISARHRAQIRKLFAPRLVKEAQRDMLCAVDECPGMALRPDKDKGAGEIPQDAHASPGSGHRVCDPVFLCCDQHPSFADQIKEIVLQCFRLNGLHRILLVSVYDSLLSLYRTKRERKRTDVAKSVSVSAKLTRL